MRDGSYTTGEVALLCRVTKRTVIKWIDGGQLRGYRIPGSRHRRVAAKDLQDFVRRHRLPKGARVAPRVRILIVDDDHDFASLIRDALRDSYTIEHAASALDAAGRAPVFQPDLILLDIRLPDVNGVDVCRYLRSRKSRRRAAILAMSAYGSEIDLEAIRSSGADDFMPKPLRVAELRRRIQIMVG
jgi:two-component system, OmpR family, response regulator RpaA